MKKKITVFLFLGLLIHGICDAQIFVRTVDLVAGNNTSAGSGKVTIRQDPALDTLISRSIEADKRLGGMEGYRIQIYRSGDRNAIEEHKIVEGKFLDLFPGIPTYPLFEKPNLYKVRVGDYRTRHEAAKPLNEIKKVFKDAYLIQGEIINFPDLNKQ